MPTARPDAPGGAQPAGARPAAGEALAAAAGVALDAYDLPAASSPEPLGLTNNAVFAVRTGEGRLALRIHRPRYRSVAETRSELQFLEVLHERLEGTGTAVPLPIRTRGGELVGIVDVAEEPRHFDLLTWVDGEVLRPGRGLGPLATYELGAALGRIHAVADGFSPGPGFTVPRWDADAMFTTASPFRPEGLHERLSREQREVFARVEELTRETLDALERQGAAEGLIHADYILVNCLLERRAGGRRVGVIDFDDLGRGFFLYDLCPLLGNLTDASNYRALRAALLAGYRSVRPLEPELEAHLPVLMAARHAAACAWLLGIHHTSGHGPPIDRHLAIRTEEMRLCLASPP